MESNKILIELRFCKKEVNGAKYYSFNGKNTPKYFIDLYVLRDITLGQLLNGVRKGLDGLEKSSNESSPEGLSNEEREISQEKRERAKICKQIFEECCPQNNKRGTLWAWRVNYMDEASDFIKAEKQLTQSDKNKTLRELGFTSSSRIDFWESGNAEPKKQHSATKRFSDAFNPARSNGKLAHKGHIKYPEYNISDRPMLEFDTTPVKIIPPQEPPKLQQQNIGFSIVSALISCALMVGARFFVSKGAGNAMIVVSIAMALSSIISVFWSAKYQKKVHQQAVETWKTQYQAYIQTVTGRIEDRQEADVKKMLELYPSMTKLVDAATKQNKENVEFIGRNVFSRSYNDRDFLSVRLGESDDVASHFDIEGESQEVIFSEGRFKANFNTHFNKIEIFTEDEEQEETHPLVELVPTIRQEYARLKDRKDKDGKDEKVPLLYSLKNSGALGIVCNSLDIQTFNQLNDKKNKDIFHLVDKVIFDLCYYHSPESVQFVIFFPETDKNEHYHQMDMMINRYRFLPHFRELLQNHSQFVFNRKSADKVLSQLLLLVQNRQRMEEGEYPLPHIVMIVYEDYGLKEHAFAQFLPEKPPEGEAYQNKLGLSFIFPVHYYEYLPRYCNDVIDYDKETITAHCYREGDEEKDWRTHKSIGFEKWDTGENSHEAFRLISALFYSRITPNGKVPSLVSTADILTQNQEDIQSVVKKQWNRGADRQNKNDVTKSLAVPIGKSELALTYLDLHEKADGPHMLVAGTTGSGKSETIISYLLALCLHFRPDEVNLLLVDMKGGGFTNRIGSLPHVVGSVTDVDGDESGVGESYMLNRFLFAMKAEVKRRERLFKKLDVDNIDTYIRANGNLTAHFESKKDVFTESEQKQLIENCKRDKLTHLFLIVDEFSELKRFSAENDNVDFIKEITRFARIGRSLGIHIILISQNIEGAITEDISINSKSRLCLKVATKQASKEMIGTADAASPFMPGNGRAYLLVGTGSRYEYFQSAYSGTSSVEDIPIQLLEANQTGEYTVFYSSSNDKSKSGTQKAKTHLQEMVSAIKAVYKEQQEKEEPEYQLHTIFRQPLPTRIMVDENQIIKDLSNQKEWR